MTSKNPQLAFMQGIQNKDIQIQGNPALVIWFQGLVKYLKPKKKAPRRKPPEGGFRFIRCGRSLSVVRFAADYPVTPASD